jgi:uncharacterized membrane protein
MLYIYNNWYVLCFSVDCLLAGFFAVSLYAYLCFCTLLTNEVALHQVKRVNYEWTFNQISEIKNEKMINVLITEEVEVNVNCATHQQDISGRQLFILCAIEMFLINFMCLY